MRSIERDVWKARMIDDAVRDEEELDREVAVKVLSETRFVVLLYEGFDVVDIARVVTGGVRTVEGVRTVLVEGAPVEWVVAYESGDSLRIDTVGGSK